MRARFMIITEVFGQRPLQMFGVQNHEMIQALSADGPNESFGVRILPRTARRGEYFFAAQRRDPHTDIVAVDAVSISQKIASGIPILESFHNLLRGPGRSGMLGDIEMQHLPPSMLQYDEHKQHFQGDRGHGEEIDRDHLTQVVVKKGLPCLTGWPGKLSQNARYRSLGNLDAQHFQLAVDARRTPQRIGNQHALDQLANLQGRSWSASSWAMRVAQSGPRPAESFALPMGDGVRLDIEKRTAPTGPPAAKSDPKYSIEGGQNRALAFSLESCELEAERGILESDGLVTAHQQPEETEDK